MFVSVNREKICSTFREVSRWLLTLVPTLLVLFFLFSGNAGRAENVFVQMRLSNGISFELPRNWVVFDQNSKDTLSASVASVVEHPISGSLPFAAILYDGRGRVMAMLNIRVYPTNDIAQRDVRSLGRSGLAEFDKELETALSTSAGKIGRRLLEWRGTRLEEIGGKAYLHSSYQRDSAHNGSSFTVHLYRLLDEDRSFTLTVSYRDDVSLLLRPISHRISGSLRY